MTHVTQRRLARERMDEPGADRDELAQSLRFIRFVNRRLGGAAAAIAPLSRWLRDRPGNETVHILDIGTGSADIPIAIARWARRHDIDVRITAVDLHETTLDLARMHIESQPDKLPINLVRADALKFMDQFEPASFDVVHAGMFLHHLPDIEVMTVLRIMHRLSTRGVIWNDLIRGLAGRIGTRVLVRLLPGMPAMARHDAVVSVEAGFTRREAHDLAARADLPNIRYRTHLLYRFSLTSETSKRRNVKISHHGVTLTLNAKGLR